MRIKIEKSVNFEELQTQFEGSVINGHIEIGIDGVWFVVDSIERKVR